MTDAANIAMEEITQVSKISVRRDNEANYIVSN
jgi:hypothetical protein